MSQKEKLAIISGFGDVSQLDWEKIIPDENNDWLNQRDPNYQKYSPLVGESDGIFFQSAIGIATNRDTWISGFSKNKILKNSKLLIDNYNSELNRLLAIPSSERRDYLNRDETFIKWSAKLEESIKKPKGLSLMKPNANYHYIDHLPRNICIMIMML